MFGVDAGAAREWVEGAASWLRSNAERFEDEFPVADARQLAPAGARGPVAERTEPDRCAATTRCGAPGRTRWTCRPTSRASRWPRSSQAAGWSSPAPTRWRPGATGPGPSNALGIVRELRVRDWLGADGEITLVGRRALSRWLEAAIPATGPKPTVRPHSRRAGAVGSRRARRRRRVRRCVRPGRAGPSGRCLFAGTGRACARSDRAPRSRAERVRRGVRRACAAGSCASRCSDEGGREPASDRGADRGQGRDRHRRRDHEPRHRGDGHAGAGGCRGRAASPGRRRDRGWQDEDARARVVAVHGVSDLGRDPQSLESRAHARAARAGAQRPRSRRGSCRPRWPPTGRDRSASPRPAAGVFGLKPQRDRVPRAPHDSDGFHWVCSGR